MPKEFDDMVSKIWASMKGKKNPRTNKPFSESDAYAVAVANWKKSHGGKIPGRESLKDWRVVEFLSPILEATAVNDEFMIRGIAINETTTRNGIKYIAQELEKAAPSFRGKPILLDHKNEIRNIVGRTTANVVFDATKKGIAFEAKIMDKDIQKMINDGRITDVSIGAKVQDLVQNKESKEITAMGIEGLEISLVAIPGDPGANIATALENSLTLKERYELAENWEKIKDEVDLEEDDEEEIEVEEQKDMMKGEDNMKGKEMSGVEMDKNGMVTCPECKAKMKVMNGMKKEEKLSKEVILIKL